MVFCSSKVGESRLLFFFFFNDTATTEIYTLSLHDALPISMLARHQFEDAAGLPVPLDAYQDRKSTRLNSSHLGISYAVFCLKKKKQKQTVKKIKKKKNTKYTKLTPH